ncbi:crystal et79 [Fusarium phyllophilum]|uniref:Crystal et79 n=1 Tax=Fusarium phyllophilum TaxID=47803 RepID=A0A8H5MRR9_9HYPO|nr:crystal et79 [Fusarium phyllophilum]
MSYLQEEKLQIMTIFDDIGDAVSSAAKAVSSTITSQPTAAPRRIAASLVNNTQKTLTWVDSGVDHGTRDAHAPDTIGPGDTGKWGLKSDGFQTGCEGWMKWSIGDNGPIVKLDYNNPYVGANSYSCSVDSAKYTAEREGGTGDHATVRFIVSNK